MTARRKTGVTRMDLGMGFGVLALLIGIAGIPGADGNKRALEIADSRIRAALDLAGSLARATQTPHGVAFDVEHDRIAVIDVQGELAVDPLTDRDALVELGQGKLSTQLDLLEADFGRAGHVAIFDSRGVPMSGGLVRLQAGEERRNIVLDAATGWVEASGTIVSR